MEFTYRGFEISVSYEEWDGQWEAFACGAHFMSLEKTRQEAVDSIKESIDKLWSTDVSSIVKLAEALSKNLSTEMSQHSQFVHPEILSVLLQKYIGRF